MTDKPPRKHNPAWADNTRAERTKRRREALDAIAQAIGYDTWRKLETAVLNGAAVVTMVQPPDSGEEANDDRLA